MEKAGRIIRSNWVKQIEEGLDHHEVIVMVGFRGLSCAELDALRRGLRQSKARLFVARNRLAQRVLEEKQWNRLAQGLADQIAFVFSNEDAVTVAKTVIEQIKDNERINIKGGVLQGRELSDEDIKQLSELPAKPVLQSQLLAVILAPLTRLAGALNAKTRDLLSILKQYADQKQEGGQSS